ncbi:Putative Purine transporter [Rhizopus microsporus]|nr:Putative Purine transporter [Rhizopus microsporus]
MTWVDRLNDYVAHSRIGKYFQLDHSGARRERKGTKFTTEIRAGLTTFFAMAYIISVNASIISSSGGTCVCNPTETDPVCDNNQEYMDCVYQVKLDLIMGTTIIAMISSILIGVFANLPLGMAPGMGLNAYFTYTVVGYHGSGKVSYETALAAVFIEGIIFFVLSILGIRQWLARIIPMSIKIAMGCGIGLYLCFIGLQSSAGIGLVTLDKSTLVTLGDIWIALITFLYVDIMDTTGTMYSMANYGGFTDKAGDFEHSTFAFMCDAASITIGSCFGSSPCTAFVESGAGIAEGGRTGITAIAIAFGFFVSIFFSPIFASFPPWSTGPALIVVGSMMLSGVRNINWDYPGDAIPAFITLAVMPFTYSIAYGVIGGILSYVVINGFVYLVDKISRGYIRPDYSLREDWWTAALSRPFLPTWIRFLIAKARGQEFDWHQDEYEFEDDEFQSPQVISDPVMEKNNSQQMMVDGISGHSLNETASIPGRGYSEKM